MSIAAIIPTYNAAAFLEGTLASVFAQTRTPDEIIVVDDCSTDDTAAIARRLGATVIVLPRNSGGPAVPLNTGIATATSDWIATLDHDDRWRPDWLERAGEALQHNQGHLVFGRVNLVPPDPVTQVEIDRRFQTLFQECEELMHESSVQLGASIAYNELVPNGNYAITCSNMFFSRTLGLQIPFDANVKYCCDYLFLQQVTQAYWIVYVNTISCDWCKSPTALYQSGNLDKIDRDLIYVYRQFQRELIHPQMRLVLLEKCRKTANDLAYAARNRGEYRLAFRDYCDSLRYGGVNRTALFGILKLPLAMLRGKRP